MFGLRNLKHLTLSRISTGLTAFAISGFLISAILTENGGTPNSQSQWRAAVSAAQQPSLRRGDEASDQARLEEWIDPVSTGSIAKEPVSRTVTEDLSVLDLIRENSTVLPGNGNGSGKVSVTVKPGDTLFGLSRKYGLSIDEIAQLNGLDAPYTIKSGQTLYIAR